MATIKIPGVLNQNDSLRTEYHVDDDFESIDDPLDNKEDVELNISEDTEHVEHATLSLDLITGNCDGYDPASVRLEQEEKLADHDFLNNRLDDGLQHRIRLIALSKIVYPDGHWKRGKYEIELATSYLDTKGARFATQSEEHSIKGVRALTGICADILCESERVEYLTVLVAGHFVLARSLLLLCKYDKSYKTIVKAVDTVEKYKKLSVVTDEQIFEIQCRVFLAAGKISIACREFGQAEEYIQNVLELTKVNKDEDSVDLIPIYHLLAQVEQGRNTDGSLCKAVKNCHIAHDISTKHYENHSEEVIQTSWALAIAYSMCRDVTFAKSAEGYLVDCLESLAVLHGESHPRVCEIQRELAKLLVRTGRTQEAIVKLKAVLVVEEDMYGEYALESIDILQLLGPLYLSDSNMKDGLKYYEAALLIEELHHGKSTGLYNNIQEVIKNIRSHSSFQRSSSNLNDSKPYFKTVHKSY